MIHASNSFSEVGLVTWSTSATLFPPVRSISSALLSGPRAGLRQAGGASIRFELLGHGGLRAMLRRGPVKNAVTNHSQHGTHPERR